MRDLPDTNPISEHRWEFTYPGKQINNFLDYSLWINEPDCILVEVHEGRLVDLSIYLQFNPTWNEPFVNSEAHVEWSFDRRVTDSDKLNPYKLPDVQLVKRFITYLKEKHATNT